MLVTFQSKSAADIVMLEGHAKQILDVLNKDVTRGVITEQEAGPAIAKLEAEFSSDHRAAPDSGADDATEKSEDGADAPDELVTTATHAYPFLEMLRAAHTGGHDVVWGV
jgi:hypothetical protein